MVGLCEGGNEPPGSLKANAVSTTLIRVFIAIGICDSEMVFGDMSPKIRYRLPVTYLMIVENLKKKQADNRPKQESNPRPSSSPDRQKSALAD
ncbi:hypothetical protein ANN_01722 [Periplaneta americana]|uniref:Uncharacterized protein n=1 Tax=Periplaneta americana TaxID=6978 RepID=A0ABQ8TX92_PERAM|nr:hypothetical protein ANN_01722 [Periplaneta americana]